MKKSLLFKVFSIMLVEIIYIDTYHFILDILGVSRLLRGWGQYKLAGQIFVEELPIIGLMLLLNYFFWKQKILLKKYPFWKGLAVVSYGILAFIVGTALHFWNGKSLGVYGALLIVTVFIGVAEELVFRGLILGTLISKGKSVLFSIVLSSVLFALLHAVNITHQPLLNTVLQVIYVIPVGIFLASIYLKTNNLIYPIFLHGMQDFMAISATGQSSSQVTSPLSVIPMYLLYLSLSFIILYGDSQQIKNFAARVRGLAIQKQESIQLPKLALDQKFRQLFTVGTLILGFISTVGYQAYLKAHLATLNSSSASQSLSSVIRSAQAAPVSLQLLQAMMYLSLALYIFLICFFHYRRYHLCWLLIPYVGGPVFAIIALTGAIKPDFRNISLLENEKI